MGNKTVRQSLSYCDHEKEYALPSLRSWDLSPGLGNRRTESNMGERRGQRLLSGYPTNRQKSPRGLCGRIRIDAEACTCGQFCHISSIDRQPTDHTVGSNLVRHCILTVYWDPKATGCLPEWYTDRRLQCICVFAFLSHFVPLTRDM